jgi:transposase
MRRVGEEHTAAIAKILEERNDLTLAEIGTRLAESTGIAVSISTVFRALRALGVTRKKKIVHASERERPDVMLLRWYFRFVRQCEEISRWIFLDETGMNLSMTRSTAVDYAAIALSDTSRKTGAIASR